MGRLATSFCTTLPPVAERDAEATAFTSAGIVLLAALLVDSRYRRAIPDFVPIVLEMLRDRHQCGRKVDNWADVNDVRNEL